MSSYYLRFGVTLLRLCKICSPVFSSLSFKEGRALDRCALHVSPQNRDYIPGTRWLFWKELFSVYTPGYSVHTEIPLDCPDGMVLEGSMNGMLFLIYLSR